MILTNPLITVTVCVRDGKKWIDDCMEAISAQTYRPLEVIAVDDGSTDGSTEELQKWHSLEGENSNGIPIRVLTQKPLGLSAGRNNALNAAKGEWVAITDIDCRPRKDWIENLFALSEGVEAVTGRVIFDEGRTSVSRLRARSIANKYSKRGKYSTLANGPCSMFKKEGLISRGGFDPSWYHAEDMEVSMKILQSGGVIHYEPKAIVDHVAEEQIQIFLQKRRRDARAHIRIIRQYHGIKHDFTSDGYFIAMLLPLLCFAVIAGAIDSLPSAMILIMCIAMFRYHFLWSVTLWIGALEGWADALVGRNGHHPLFGKRE